VFTISICGEYPLYLSICVCNPPPCLVMSAASRVIWLRLCVCRFDGLPLRVIGQCMYILVLLPLRQSVLAGLPVRRWSVCHCQSAAGLLVRSAHVHGAYWTWLGAMWLVRWDEKGDGICGGLDAANVTVLSCLLSCVFASRLPPVVFWGASDTAGS
jgi:hypothetical protein